MGHEGTECDMREQNGTRRSRMGHEGTEWGMREQNGA